MAAYAAAYAGRGYTGYPGLLAGYPTGNPLAPLGGLCLPYHLDQLAVYNLHAMQL